MKTIGILTVALAIGIPLAAYAAWVYSPLWGWFVEPATGIAYPGAWTLAAWLMLARVPFATMKKDERDPVEALVSGTLMGLIYPPIVLLSGFIYHLLGA